MDETLNDLADYIAGKAGDAFVSSNVALGELMITVTREGLPATLKFLRDDSQCQFKILVDITAADFPERIERFEVVYNLLSPAHNQRIRVKVTTDEATPVPSAVPQFSSAGWYERETWDMFGIVFDGHPALTRILMPDDWPGHPQRKDYPLGGIPVEYKGGTVPPPDQRRSYN